MTIYINVEMILDGHDDNINMAGDDYVFFATDHGYTIPQALGHIALTQRNGRHEVAVAGRTAVLTITPEKKG